jgi:lipocalin
MTGVLAATLISLDPFKFSGAWYEVGNHKVGYEPLSAMTCMDSRGIYEYNPETDEFDVQLGCRHMDRKVSAIKAVMRCPPLKDGNVSAKCAVRYPSAPYVQPSYFRVLDTDYESYALVEGAEDKSFVQIFSRYARPGNRFIEAKAQLLRAWGYDPDWIHATPVTLESEPQVQTSLDGLVKP